MNLRYHYLMNLRFLMNLMSLKYLSYLMNLKYLQGLNYLKYLSYLMSH
jgi:hypothetical protein